MYHRVTHLGSHLMDDLEKQDVLTTRTQLNKAYEVSKSSTPLNVYHQISHVALQTCSCCQIRV